MSFTVLILVERRLLTPAKANYLKGVFIAYVLCRGILINPIF